MKNRKRTATGRNNQKLVTEGPSKRRDIVEHRNSRKNI